jgi:hypothetical protein
MPLYPLLSTIIIIEVSQPFLPGIKKICFDAWQQHEISLRCMLVILLYQSSIQSIFGWMILRLSYSPGESESPLPSLSY